MTTAVGRLRRQVVRPRVGLVMIGVVILGITTWSVFGSVRAVEAERETQVQAEQLQVIADPLAALCVADPTVRARLGDAACFTAQEVVQMPTAGPVAAPYAGQGRAGRGIVATVIGGDGELLVTYTDGAVIDAGRVVGEAGVEGRGIVTSQITAGRLEMVFTDGAVQDLGEIVGARGETGPSGAAGGAARGITTTAVVAGRLVVTYSDGTTEDAGPVPPGPAGPPAELPAQVVRTYPDGTVETCVRDGGPAEAPVFACSERV